MASPRKSHMALFGNVRIVRDFCPDCQTVAFVIKNHFACCDTKRNPAPEFYKRECEPEQRRRMPSATIKKLLLEIQQGRCFYCEREFGSTVTLRRRRITLKCHYDHLVPYSYSQNNQTDNFVAACNVCNNWKYNLVFQTIEEAAVYLNGKWNGDTKDDDDFDYEQEE